METTDVLIIGAGPTGLMLANWLVRLGLRVLIADSKAGPTRESRAVIVQARSLEVYDQLGMPAPDLRAWCARHPAFRLHVFPYTRAARAAGLAESATYLLRPDGYVSLALPRFEERELARMVRQGWGWTDGV